MSTAFAAIPSTSALALRFHAAADGVTPAAVHATIGAGTAHPLQIRIPIPPLQSLEILTPTSLRGKIPGTAGGPPLSALKPSIRPNALRSRATTLSLLGGQTGGGGTNWPVPNGTSLQDLANMGELNDYTIMTCLVRNTVTLLSTSDLYTDVENIWNGVVAEMKKDSAIGAAVGVTVGVLDAALSGVGFDLLADIIAELVAAVAAAIAAAIQAVGLGAFVAATAAGGTFGYVGAIIGAIVGACIAVGNLIYGGQHLSITDGRGFSCKDYVATNVPQASQWLADNSEKLVGLTALRFSQQAALFLANPTWLYKNQRYTGMSQPAPPDPGSGDPLDMVYTQVPGAFELLNRAQFAQAVVFVNASAGHLRDCASIPNPVPGQRKYYGDTSGTPYGTPRKGKGVWPNPDQTQYDDIYSSTILTWTIGDCGGAHQMIPGTQTAAAWYAQYAACPNLTTNGNAYSGVWPDGQGKISGQTDICPGIYALQVMFPTLTTVQCELIFDNATSTFGPVPQLMNTPQNPGGGSWAAPLPPHPSPPPPPPGVFPPGTQWTSFGPSMAGLAALGPGGLGFSLTSAPALMQLNGQNPAAAAAAVASMTSKTSPSTAGGRIQPITPAEALATISAIATQSASAGTLTAPQLQNLGTIAKGLVQQTQAQAKTGHPVALYNAKVLDAAHRLSVAAGYVSKYVTPAAATMILKNAGYGGLPLGSGKYDRNLPLVLEQTVDRILYDPKSTTADLQNLAAALVQAA
jgi:hypothetical protein